jgi:hypothetical protein
MMSRQDVVTMIDLRYPRLQGDLRELLIELVHGAEVAKTLPRVEIPADTFEGAIAEGAAKFIHHVRFGRPGLRQGFLP